MEPRRPSRPSRAGSLLVALVLVLPAVLRAQGAGYHVTARWAVGGDQGFWDYLYADAAARRLYVSHADRVHVLDLDTGKPVGEIANTQGVHGIAIAPELGRGFVSDGRANQVTVFDTKTLATTGSIATTGQNPDAILYDPATRRVFTFNGRSGNTTAIDAAGGKVIGTLALGGKPEEAVADGTGRIFANIEDKGEIVAFDGRTLKEEARWSIAPCEEPSGLALDNAHHRLFSACGNGILAVSDAAGHKLVTTVPIGRGVDGAAFDPATGLAFSPNGRDGTLTVVHEDSPDKYSVVATVPTQASARTITLDTRTHRVFTPAARFGPAPAAAPGQRRRPPMIPGSFTVLVVGP